MGAGIELAAFRPRCTDMNMSKQIGVKTCPWSRLEIRGQHARVPPEPPPPIGLTVLDRKAPPPPPHPPRLPIARAAHCNTQLVPVSAQHLYRPIGMLPLSLTDDVGLVTRPIESMV